MKLSTICFIAAGAAFSVNPVMVFPWLGLGVANIAIDKYKNVSKTDMKNIGQEIIAHTVLSMKPIEGIAYIRKMTNCGLKDARDHYFLLKDKYPQYCK